MKKKRKQHTAEFKARVAFEAIQGLKTQNEIAKEYEIHPVMVGKWKRELVERMPEIFTSKPDKSASNRDKDKNDLERKVGQLTMEVEFLEKKCRQLGVPLQERSR